MLTYGDGLSNVNIRKLKSTHKKNKKLATVTIVKPQARFGSVKLKNKFKFYYLTIACISKTRYL